MNTLLDLKKKNHYLLVRVLWTWEAWRCFAIGDPSQVHPVVTFAPVGRGVGAKVAIAKIT